MTDHRRAALVLSLTGLLTMGAAEAVDPTLQVVSGTSSSETRRPVALTSARFDIATRSLIATTRAGNFACSSSQVPGAGVLKLRIDGNSYPVTTSALPGTLDAPIEYLPSTVTFALGLSGAGVAGNCSSTHATATNLGLVFPTQRRLPVAESVFFDIPTRSFQLRVAEPVLCESYVTQSGTSGLNLLLNNSNDPLFNAGTAKLLPGFSNVDYSLGGFNLVPTPQGSAEMPRVQCSVPGSTVVPTPGGGSLGDSIFNSGFETQGSLDSPSDLHVSISGIGSGVASSNQRSTGALPGGALQFVLRVVNQGDSAAANVRLREFATGAQAIAQAGQPAPAAILAGETGSSTCVRVGAAGACPAFGFPISMNLGSIPAGEGYEFTLTRVVTASASAGHRGQLGYAAFVDSNSGGPDANLTNNGAWLAADLVSNQQPVIAVIADQSMLEDAAPLQLAISITDPEGDPLQTPTVSVDDSTLFPPGSVQLTGSASPYTLSLMPGANQNGTTTVRISATDGNSAPAVRTFPITVTSVNDPPQFTLNVAGGEIVMTEGVGGCVVGNCTASATNFITGRLPGPATATDESGQIVRPNTQKDSFGFARLVDGSCAAASVDGVDPAVFFLGGALPLVNEPGGAGNFILVAALAGVAGAVDCAITVVDDGSPVAESAPQSLRIRFQPALP
jgi:hypothetical protein